MNSRRIVEYSPAFAAAVAEMWNASSDGWNGRIFNSNEAKVLQDEARTSYRNLFLSVHSGKVLGYAKLTDYAEEPGVAYIELLNVLPTLHGQGIGRDLVKCCVLRAAELGYQRIDLFTWPGNTKAVPLYKKCGFFWEKMENQSTHLMNFIPGLLNLELLKPLWKEFDWYEDSQRELKIEPDGRNENGFDIYDYVWEKDGKRLEVSFERFGRGMVALKTPRFSVKVSALCPKPVFGTPAPISYYLERLDGDPLQVSIEGISDGIISHEFKQEHLLETKLELQSHCFPNPLQKKLNEWETSPRVSSLLKLDGMSVPLAIGLKVQYPLTAELQLEDSLFLPNREYRMFLNLQSHYSQGCLFKIVIPDDKHILLKEQSFSFRLEGQQRKFIELRFTAVQACVYNPHLKVTAEPDACPSLDFELDCFCIIPMTCGRHGVDNSEFLMMVNAFKSLEIMKVGDKNTAWISSKFISGIRLLCPQAGKPYSEELESMLPYETLFHEGPCYIETETRFRSRDIPGLSFAWIYRLWDSGLVEVFPRVISQPPNRQDLWLKLPFSLNDVRFSFFYEGKIVETDAELLDFGMCDLPRKCPQENWLFARCNDSTISLIWQKDTHLAPEEYCLAWEVSLDELNKKGLKSPQPLQIHLDVFKNAWQLRNVAQGNRKISLIHPGIELQVNCGNPVLKLPCRAEVVQVLDMDLKASYNLNSSCLKNPETLFNPIEKDDQRVIGWELSSPPTGSLELIQTDITLPYTDLLRGQLTLYPQGNFTYREENEIIYCDNGSISFGAARDGRLPGLISLKYNGSEILDNNYPDYGPKSFFNPYLGGMSIIFNFISIRALMKESHRVEQTNLTDQFGNNWRGLAICTKIEHYEPYRGIEFRQLYLTLPGVPVIMVLGEISNSEGIANLNGLWFMLYRKLVLAKGKETFLYADQGNHWIPVRHCDNEVNAYGNYEGAAVTVPGSSEYMQLWTLGQKKMMIQEDPSTAGLYMFMEFSTMLTDIVPQKTQPVFLIFSNELYKKDMLGQLLSVEV